MSVMTIAEDNNWMNASNEGAGFPLLERSSAIDFDKSNESSLNELRNTNNNNFKSIVPTSFMDKLLPKQ